MEWAIGGLGVTLFLLGVRQLIILHFAAEAARQEQRADIERLAKEGHERGEKIFAEPDPDLHSILKRMRQNRDS